jgi:hypothetical protein
MQDFFEVFTVEQVISLLSAFSPLPPERADMLESDGRVLTEDIIVKEDLPPATRGHVRPAAFFNGRARDWCASLPRWKGWKRAGRLMSCLF